MPVTGDFAALRSLVRRIEAVAGSGPESHPFKQALFTRCAEGARSALDDSFIKSIDPYGKPWKPLVSRKGKPLLDTGRLASSYTYQTTDDGFVVETNVTYAPYHQYGAKVPPHSRVHAALAFDKNGRFVSVKTARGRKRADRYWLGHVTYSKGITIPRRQMVPMQETGGIGDRWSAAINDEAKAYFKEWLAELG